MSVAPTLRNLRIVHKKRQSGKSKVPAKQHGARKSNILLTLGELLSTCAINLKPEEREFVDDSGASMHMISRKDLSDAENGYFDEIVQSYDSHNRQWRSAKWIHGQKPHLIKDGIRTICNTENFVPFVVPGLSSSSSASSSTLRTPMKQESRSSSSSSSSPSSPTVGEIQVREREDASNRDISQVPVSNLVDDGSGKPERIQANEIPNK